MAILKADKVFYWNGVKVNEYLLEKHNSKKIALPKEQTKLKGITIHNTNWITTASNTTPAEQYTRATINGNMGTVRTHFYVDNTCAWQNLNLNSANWTCADGTKDPNSGNNTTIAVECIMKGQSDSISKKSEDNAAKLVAYLLNKYDMTVEENLFTHTYWLNVKDGKFGDMDYLNTLKNPYKTCPLYIIPHWEDFKKKVNSYLEKLRKTTTSTPTTMYRVRKTWEDSKSQIGAFSNLDNAKKACKEGYSVFDENGKVVYTVKEEKKENTPVQEKPSSTTQNKKEPDVYYRAYAGGKWLGEITNYNNTNSNGYAGIDNRNIRGLVVKSSEGKIKYRVKVKNGGWLSWITKYDINNWKSGCAGLKTRDIEAIQMKLDGVPGYEVRYRVSINGSKTYLDWITGYNNTNNKGYAGIIGKTIDKIQVDIVKV